MKSNSIHRVDDHSNNSRKRLFHCDSTSDIINNLPKDIIDNIMNRLPIKDAARTSVLSKKWKLRWIHIPQLIFRRISSKNQHQEWFRICQILSLHRGPLRKFYLSVSLLGEYERRFIEQILIFLSGNDIQDYTLLILEDPSNPLYILPSYFFQCIHLTDLYLSRCEFRSPPGFAWFSKLTALKLDSVNISVDNLKALIFNAPLLQELDLTEIDHSGRYLEIDAPNLKLLMFANMSSAVIFKNVPVLSTITIVIGNGLLGEVPDIVKVFDCLPAIEFLDVDATFLVESSKGLIPERLPRMLSHLKFLELYGMRFNSSKDVQCALLLIRSSPKLQKLKIDLKCCVVADDGVEQLLNLPSIVEDSFDQLQEVTLIEFYGILPELEFVKLLLAKSLVLKKIVIMPSIRISSEKVVEILTAVTRFQRASPKAEIVFLDRLGGGTLDAATRKSLLPYQKLKWRCHTSVC